MIIVKRLRVINRLGTLFEYTHVEEIKTYKERGIEFLYIKGETDDSLGFRKIVCDRHIIKDLLTMDAEFYIPKV